MNPGRGSHLFFSGQTTQEGILVYQAYGHFAQDRILAVLASAEFAQDRVLAVLASAEIAQDSVLKKFGAGKKAQDNVLRNIGAAPPPRPEGSNPTETMRKTESGSLHWRSQERPRKNRISYTKHESFCMMARNHKK